MHSEAIEILEAYLLGQKIIAQTIIEKNPAERIFVDRRRINAIQKSIEFLKQFKAVSVALPITTQGGGICPN